MKTQQLKTYETILKLWIWVLVISPSYIPLSLIELNQREYEGEYERCFLRQRFFLKLS